MSPSRYVGSHHVKCELGCSPALSTALITVPSRGLHLNHESVANSVTSRRRSRALSSSCVGRVGCRGEQREAIGSGGTGA